MVASHAVVSTTAAGQGAKPPWTPKKGEAVCMKDAFVKIRISAEAKSRLSSFADECGKSASEIVRSALEEAMRGRVAGTKRRHDIAELRRSTNLMLAAFAGKPIDVVRLKEIAAQVRKHAGRVLA